MKKAGRAVTTPGKKKTSGQGPGKQEGASRGTHTVMVVDDSSTMRAIIGKELEADGYSVITFSDGLEALSSLHWMASPPDLITLDIDMPRMDGFACCEKLREMESSGLFGDAEIRTPVLFVSANDTLVNRSRGFHLGSLQFISKPFVRGDISAAVSRVLRPQATYGGMNALVIDDNRGVRKMVVSCLEQIGLTVFEAENGKIAYDLLKKYIDRIDLIIVDYDMPVMRGDECIHLARQLPEAEHLPMLSLSGSGESDAVLRMFRAGATDYLVKPFIVEELLARVQVHLQLRQHVRHLQDLNRDLYDKAVNDALTGLRNKRFFLEAFAEMFAMALRAQADLSCLFFDLDHFKQVNDTCGHPFGDYVLEGIGTMIKSTVRCGDLGARYGGEEFVVALPGTDLAGAGIVAEKIRGLVEAYQFSDQGRQWPVTVSIGVASLQEHLPATAQDLLQLADQALYRAKKKGRNRVELFSP
ncbi:diguanylate cyclase [Desulfobulbus alkaliphilus]|uniref:diguanylate cyclase n=1 Tax=Desulfobulbus alkaliphilus TaxID=869814 RepID=UPI0019648A95|nr:diguanylate cyclase [Desulfobulbus alkaliphilus]MBM9536734.1 diguanylate cyclase [Desulfobulbus alkaliphilus]